MEIEFEWLRQWYIQGTNHQQLHMVYWQDKIAELEKIWFKLQEKEIKKLEYLSNAVLVLESRQKQEAGDMPPPPRKQRKHAQIVENMGGVNVYNACIEQLKDAAALCIQRLEYFFNQKFLNFSDTAVKA